VENSRNTKVAIPKELKIRNRKTVLLTFMKGDPISAIEVSDATGISRQTVQKSIEHFLANDLLVLIGKGVSGAIGGKRPELYALNPDKYLLAIQNRSRGFVFALTTLAGRIIKSWDCSFTNNRTTAVVIYRTIEEQSEKYLTPLEKQRLFGVCYSLGGIIDRKTGRIRFNATDQGDLDYNRLTDLFPTAAYAIVENDARVAACAALKGYADRFANIQAITVFVGVGIAGGFFSEGKIFFGCHSLAGEIGHIIVDPSDPELCKCGNHGCLERLISIQRIRALIANQPERYHSSALRNKCIEQIEYPDVFEASEAGDSLSREISEFIANCVAAALKSIFVTFDPQIIIFQGYFSFADSHFKQALLDSIHSFLYYPSDSRLELIFDKRSWAEVETIGAVAALTTKIIADESLYN
jgi:N-acetylglucosamine repressor